MKQKIVLFTITLLFALQTKAQNKVVDSLELILISAKHDTSRCSLLIKIIELENDIEDYSKHNQKLLAIVEKNLKIIEAEPERKKTEEYKKFKIALGRAIYTQGCQAQEEGEGDKATKYYQNAIIIQQETKDDKGLANSLNNLGEVASYLGDIPKALENYEKSLKIREHIKDTAGISYSLNNIGFIHKDQGDFPVAIDYFQKSLKLQQQINDKQGIAASFNNIGLIHFYKGDIKGAVDYFKKSLNVYEEINDKHGQANGLINIGFIIGNSGNMKEAMPYLEKSLIILEEIKDKKGHASSLLSIASLLYKQKDRLKGIDYAEKSLKESKELGFPIEIRNAAKFLHVTYTSAKNYEKALTNYELYVQMSDSINNTENRKISIKSQLKYEYEKKAAADSIKVAEEKKLTSLQLKQEESQRYFLYAGLLLTLIFGAFMFNRFRIIKKQKNIIEEQKTIVEKQKHIVDEKQKEVMDSIHYAKRIQQSLLPTEKYLERILTKK